MEKEYKLVQGASPKYKQMGIWFLSTSLERKDKNPPPTAAPVLLVPVKTLKLLHFFVKVRNPIAGGRNPNLTANTF